MLGNNEIENKLKIYDNDYENTQATTVSEPLPSGHYQAIIETVELTTSQKDAPMMVWTLKIVSPSQYAGRRAKKFSLINNPQSLPYIKQEISLCGVSLSKLSDLALPHTLERFLDIWLDIKLVENMNSDFMNVYFQRKITPVTATNGGKMGDGALPPPISDDDIPF